MKTKIFSLLFAIIASVGTMFADNISYDVKIDGVYYNLNYTTETASVTYHGADSYSNLNEYSGTVTIPTSVTKNGKTYSVTSIGKNAFQWCSELTSVTIPYSVTSIGDYAFHNCSGLTSIEIPNSVTSIGIYAFSHCTSLTSVYIPNSITSIGDCAFYECAGLTSATIGNNVSTIGVGTFYNCSGLTSVTIGSSVTSIGENAFKGCSHLANIVCWAYTPPQCGSYAFYFINMSKSIPLYVPGGTVNAYKKASTWKEFTNYQSTSGEQYTCSHAAITITIMFSPTLLRWEKSYDGGNTWTNIACSDYQYTEENPASGIVKYRALGTDNSYSDVVTITYVDAVPETIQALPATSTKTVEESITFTADVVDNDYSYQWKKGGVDILDATNGTYTISSIKSSDAGEYTCYISNGCNDVTTTTATLAVNKCAQTINFPEIPTFTYETNLTYTLPETTDKGLTITYQSMNTSVATVSGNVLTIKAPGTAIISASQIGNDDYLEATQVSRTLTVNKRTQTITFDELPVKTYEDVPFTLPQKTDEGLTISYTCTNTAVATVSGNTVTILKPGTTDIIASQAGDATHYAATEVSQTLIVNKAVQEMSFGALSSKTYGDAPFALSKVSNKNLTITYTSSDASIASITDNIVTIKHPGTVTITATQEGNAYYLAAETKSQTLTINKANQTINLSPLESRAFDSEDFELPNLTDKGQTISYVSSKQDVATITGNIVHITGVGMTQITATQDGNEYYNAAPSVSQTLTITKATQTINFPELSACVYGQDTITLVATVNSGMEIEFESSNNSVATVIGNKLAIVGAGTCFITASADGNQYYYTATSVQRTLVVNKAQSVLTFEAIEGEYTYGDTPITLTAYGSSGNIVFNSSNPTKLLIAGTNAIIQGAGHFTITASIAEDANHLPISASQEITIRKAPLTLTIDNTSRKYGDNNPVFTCTYKGFVNGDTKADLTANVNISTSANVYSPVGAYEIFATGTTDDNYEITVKKGILTIEKAPLSISAQGTREYGENNSDFVFAYEGFKNNENSSVLTTQPTAYTTAKKSSPVGTYPIYVSGASATNYEIAHQEGSFVITKAPLTIFVIDATRKQGEENPKFELNIDGFKLEDTVADLDKLPTIQCEANVNSPAGTYPIFLLEDGYDDNYAYNLVNGVLTVENTEAIEDVSTSMMPHKVINNGQIYILRGDKTYTITGTEVK